MSGVSVIIPCYNAGKFLAEAVASVHATMPSTPYEIIIVDDASTDAETKRVIEKIASEDNKVRAFSMSKNSGQSAARNYAMSVARHDIILPLDADDRMARAKSGAYIDQAYESLRNDAGIVIVTTPYRQFGATSGQCPAPPFKPQYQLVKNLLPPFSAFRREEALKINGYDESKRFGEDWDFFITLVNRRFSGCRLMNVKTLPDIHVDYRTHATGLNASVSHRVSKAVALQSIMDRNPEIYDYYYPGKTAQELGSLSALLKVGFQMATSDPVSVCQNAASALKRRVHGKLSQHMEPV